MKPNDLEAAVDAANLDLRRPSRTKIGRLGSKSTEKDLKEVNLGSAGKVNPTSMPEENRISANNGGNKPAREINAGVNSIRKGSGARDMPAASGHERKASAESVSVSGYAVPPVGSSARSLSESKERRTAIDAGPSMTQTNEYIDFGRKASASSDQQRAGGSHGPEQTQVKGKEFPVETEAHKTDSHAIDMPQEDADGSISVPIASVGSRVRDRDGLSKEERTLRHIEEAKQLVGEALQKAVARGERMEQVEADAEALKMQTAVFHTDTKKAAERIKWLEYRSKIICASIAIGVILVLFLLAAIASKLR
jgi:hypothetical protein